MFKQEKANVATLAQMKNDSGCDDANTFFVSNYSNYNKFEQSKYTENYKQLTLQEKRKRHLIFSALINELRNLQIVKSEKLTEPMSVAFEVQNLSFSRNFGDLDNEELFELGLVQIPNFLMNALVCERLSNRFGDLTLCNCFRSVAGGFWRLDTDEALSRKGLFLPQRDRNGLIYALKVFRYADDPRPFTLRTRRGN